MTQRDLIKQEIDKVREENLHVLLKIVQALEEAVSRTDPRRDSDWRSCLDETHGSLHQARLERGLQGELETREPFHVQG